MTSGYTCRIADSPQQIDRDDWLKLCGNPSDILMDLRFLQTVHKTLRGEQKFWYVTVHDRHGLPVACACFSQIVIDAGIFGRLPFRTYLRLVRTIFPEHLRFRAMLCGLPVSTGSGHLRIATRPDPSAIIRVLDDELKRLAERQRAQLISWKEFTLEEKAHTDCLSDLGYLPAESLPMNCFERHFSGFADYQAALRSHYRYKLKRSREKFDRAGLRVEHVTDVSTIHQLYTPSVHELYVRLARRPNNTLEVLPHAFFWELASQLAGQVVLTVVLHGDSVVAFAWGLNSGKIHRNMLIGFDEALNQQGDLYFNLMLADLRYALDQGSRIVYVGQTADDFKSRLGCVQRPRWFYVKLTSSVLDRCLRWFSGRFLPPSRPAKSRRVFQDEAAAKPAGADEVSDSAVTG
jgi:predicted N-acyltransferase